MFLALDEFNSIQIYSNQTVCSLAAIRPAIELLPPRGASWSTRATVSACEGPAADARAVARARPLPPLAPLLPPCQQRLLDEDEHRGEASESYAA